MPQNAHIHELPSVSTPISLSQQSYINGIANGVVTNGMNGVPATTPPSSQSQQGPSQIQASPSMAEEPKPTEREPEVEAKHLNQMTETDSNGNKEVIPKKEASPIKPAVKLQSRYKRSKYLHCSIHLITLLFQIWSSQKLSRDRHDQSTDLILFIVKFIILTS